MITLDGVSATVTLPAAREVCQGVTITFLEDFPGITVTSQDGTKILGKASIVVPKDMVLAVQYRAGQWRRPIPEDECAARTYLRNFWEWMTGR